MKTSQTRRGPSLSCLMILLAVALLVFSAARYFLDRDAYEKGHKAYRRADCVLAIYHYNLIIDSWRLVDIGSYVPIAQREKEECFLFQEAVIEQQAGDYSVALVAYNDLISSYSDSALITVARSEVESLFEKTDPSALASQMLCERMDTFLENDLIPQRNTTLPLLYIACGQALYAVNDHQGSFALNARLLTEYPVHPLVPEVEMSLLDNPVSCEEVDLLGTNNIIANRPNFLPSLYFRCGQRYETSQEYTKMILIYERLLRDYPDHILTNDVETALLENPNSCDEIDLLESNRIFSNRADFLPTLFFNCGQLFEDQQDYSKAIQIHERFLEIYPNHLLAPQVKAALARTLVAEARAAGAGQIPDPRRSGSTGSESTMVVIQNDSPEELRLVFSGPEPRIEELDACSSCNNYFGIGPVYCPEKGPIGRYTLKAGQYDVLVEASSSRGVIPFTGIWNLGNGGEYYSCFFIVTTVGP